MTALRVFLLVSGASVLGAILWLAMRWPPGVFGHLAGNAMMLTGAWAALQPLARATGVARAMVALLGAAAVGAIAEIAGLYRGFFGSYIYTDLWQPAVELPGGFLFPLMLPVMWSVILATAYSYARQRLRPVAAVVVGATLAMLADLVAEPVLTGPVGFWIWLEPTPLLGAPWLNAVGWFLTSLVGCGWVSFVSQGRYPAGREPLVMLSGALAGTAIIGVTHGEPRALMALLLVPPLFAWRPLAPTG